MSQRTLYLAWQAPKSRAWYPVGSIRAEANGGGSPAEYVYQYTRGAEKAKNDGFMPLLSFPDQRREYRSPELFPFLRNRVLNASRPELKAVLQYMDLLDSSVPDPMEFLAISGGTRRTDTFELFPPIAVDPDQRFSCRFFLRRWRQAARDPAALLALNPGDHLQIAVELNNPATGLAVQLQVPGSYMLAGWAPRYLVTDLTAAAASPGGQMEARIVRVNPDSAPDSQRVLIELSGKFPPAYTPMSGDEYLPLS